MPDVIIIATGDELLFGTTVNTTSSFISGHLFGSNFNVIRHITTGDSTESIVSSLTESLEKADTVIVTGGLGPTDDDNTVEAICSVFNLKITVDQESARRIFKFFETMNFSHNVLDSKMATVPENSYIIQNRHGLAPGFIVHRNNKLVISLPGVPVEAENMMTQSIIPYLHQNHSFRDDMKLVYRMSGIRESDINTKFREIELPGTLRMGITSKSGICDLIITAIPEDTVQKETIDKAIKEKFGNFLLNFNSSSPEEELVLLLKKNGLTISTAESCTGGLIAKRITDIAGSSDVFKGSIIAYSNEIKEKFLDVSEKTLQMYGAVSENTASEMAVSIRKKYNTDISVSTTGIAGPSGGTDKKPVGTVCFGFQIKDYHYTCTKLIKGSRDRIRTFSSLYAINFLRDYLKNLN